MDKKPNELGSTRHGHTNQHSLKNQDFGNQSLFLGTVGTGPYGLSPSTWASPVEFPINVASFGDGSLWYQGSHKIGDLHGRKPGFAKMGTLYRHKNGIMVPAKVAIKSGVNSHFWTYPDHIYIHILHFPLWPKQMDGLIFNVVERANLNLSHNVLFICVG